MRAIGYVLLDELFRQVEVFDYEDDAIRAATTRASGVNLRGLYYVAAIIGVAKPTVMPAAYYPVEPPGPRIQVAPRHVPKRKRGR